MRLLSLAVVAGLFAGGGFAADEPKKADKKAAKVTGVLGKVDGDKLVVTVKGDGGDKEVTYTTTDKTKFFVEEAAPAAKDAPKEGDKKPEEPKKPDAPKDGEKKAEEPKKEEPKADTPAPKKEKKPAAKRTEIKITDLKSGSRLAIMAGEDKVATEVVQLPAAAKKADKKPADAPKEGEKKPDAAKPDVKKDEPKKDEPKKEAESWNGQQT